jgi:hypothetical protein
VASRKATGRDEAGGSVEPPELTVRMLLTVKDAARFAVALSDFAGGRLVVIPGASSETANR